MPYNLATKEELEKYVNRTVGSVKRHDWERFKIMFLNIAGAVDSPASNLRQRYERIFVILDNAAAHTSIAMREHIGRTECDVAPRFLPPHTPQHNPIGVEWRESKRAISEAFFGRFDKLQERIRQLLRSGEVPIVKILDYVLNTAREPEGALEECPTHAGGTAGMRFLTCLSKCGRTASVP